MDFAGLAALLGVPVALAAILAPLLAEVAPLRRLERLNRVLKDSGVTGPHRAALEQARNDLAARAAFALLIPMKWFPAIYAPLIITWGAIWMSVALFVDHPVRILLLLDQSPLTFWLGFANSFAGVGMLAATQLFRRRAWKQTWNLPLRSEHSTRA